MSYAQKTMLLSVNPRFSATLMLPIQQSLIFTNFDITIYCLLRYYYNILTINKHTTFIGDIEIAGYIDI